MVAKKRNITKECNKHIEQVVSNMNIPQESSYYTICSTSTDTAAQSFTCKYATCSTQLKTCKNFIKFFLEFDVSVLLLPCLSFRKANTTLWIASKMRTENNCHEI